MITLSNYWVFCTQRLSPKPQEPRDKKPNGISSLKRPVHGSLIFGDRIRPNGLVTMSLLVRRHRPKPKSFRMILTRNFFCEANSREHVLVPRALLFSSVTAAVN